MTATESRDALDRFIEDRKMLPGSCPSWCGESHAQALEEGATVREASRHYGPEFFVLADSERRTAGHVNIHLMSDHRETGWWGTPMVQVSVDSGEVALNTGQVRILARQLLHLADTADLER